MTVMKLLGNAALCLATVAQDRNTVGILPILPQQQRLHQPLPLFNHVKPIRIAPQTHPVVLASVIAVMDPSFAPQLQHLCQADN